METESIKNLEENIEIGKKNIEKSLSDLKHTISSYYGNLKTQRKALLEKEDANFYAHPLVAVTEFFFIGFYTGKLLQKIRRDKFTNEQKSVSVSVPLKGEMPC